MRISHRTIALACLAAMASLSVIAPSALAQDSTQISPPNVQYAMPKATYANTAGYADKAGSAGYANTATTASSANYATSAGTASRLSGSGGNPTVSSVTQGSYTIDHPWAHQMCTYYGVTVTYTNGSRKFVSTGQVWCRR